MIISTDLLPKVIIITLNVAELNFFSMDKMWLWEEKKKKKTGPIYMLFTETSELKIQTECWWDG